MNEYFGDPLPLGAEACNQSVTGRKENQQPVEALLRSLRKKRTKNRPRKYTAIKRDYKKEPTPPIEAFAPAEEEPVYDHDPAAESWNTPPAKPWNNRLSTAPRLRTMWRPDRDLPESWDPRLAPKYVEDTSSSFTNGSSRRRPNSSPSADGRDPRSPHLQYQNKPMQVSNPRHFNGGPRMLKRFSVFWRKDYDVEKQVAKGEEVTVTRLIRKDDGRYDFEAKAALKMDRRTRKFCFVFFVPPGPAALLIIYMMAENYRIQEELQRRYNTWLHADLLFDLNDSLEDYVGRITLKSVSYINVQNLALRLLGVVNSQLQDVRGALVVPPDLVKDKVCNMFLRNRGRVMVDTRRDTQCCFFIRKLAGGDVRMVVGGHNRKALEKAMVMILNRMNPLVAEAYDEDTLILQECEGAYRCILKQFAEE